MTKIGRLEGNNDGIDKLLIFPEEIYGEDDMGDTYEKYVSFNNKKRKSDQLIQDFIVVVRNRACSTAFLIPIPPIDTGYEVWIC